MNANCKGALNLLNTTRLWKFYEHKGQSMSKNQVKAVLEFGVANGYENTGQIPDEDIERIMNENL